jgi:prepilin-type N-terminal cleavage/methylation domain-containing protein
MSSATRQPSRCAVAGFTLIEIMVALLILGIMSALGYGTYRAARISAERTEESMKRSREIEFGMRVMVQDFAEAVPRPVRDILGSQSRLPAMLGTGGSGTLSAVTGTSSGSGSGQRGVHRRFDARRLVEHGRSAAQHLAARVVRPGQ